LVEKFAGVFELEDAEEIVPQVIGRVIPEVVAPLSLAVKPWWIPRNKETVEVSWGRWNTYREARACDRCGPFATSIAAVCS